MAHPVPFRVDAPDPAEVLRARLDAAPREHAAAVLAAYDLLQELHDRGILDLAKSGLTAGADLVETIIDSVNAPEPVRALRNLLFWRGVLGRIEPEWFQGIFQAIPDALAVATAQRNEPLSLWKIVRRALTRDSLRGLTAASDFLESFGRHLNSLEHTAEQGPREAAGASHK